jgi:SSS family solute:Na+ symporter
LAVPSRQHPLLRIVARVRRTRRVVVDALHVEGRGMTTLVVVVIYLAVLLGIGVVSSRRGLASAEDYFLAGRGFGTIVLFMALFGTNVTAFALLGLPGLAYRKGIGVFGFFGAAAAFWGVVVFILLGYPIWNLGKRHGYVTPSQMFAERWASPAVGYVVLFFMLLYTVPYLVIGVMGGGYAISRVADGHVSYEIAALSVTVVTVTYTSMGGMRGTAWTNVFQAGVFLLFLIVACIAWRRKSPNCCGTTSRPASGRRVSSSALSASLRSRTCFYVC